MSTFLWIFFSGLLMSAIALIGSITLILKKETLDKILLPLVAFAAGSLIGGAFFHLLPVAIDRIDNTHLVFSIVAIGFLMFLALEQFMHWHHCHRGSAEHKEPMTYLILMADGMHNFLGGLAIGGVFMVDIRLGIAAWLAAAMHEIPQELGDFGVLIKGGWDKKSALLYNFASGLTFLLGSMVAYFSSTQFNLNTNYLIAFGAGNFIYIAASDLIPQINKEHTLKNQVIHYSAFCGGLVMLSVLAIIV